MARRNFALLGAGGAGGAVAPRHLKAIADTGNTLVAAVDPHDSVGVLDRWFPEAAFSRADRGELRRQVEQRNLHAASASSPFASR